MSSFPRRDTRSSLARQLREAGISYGEGTHLHQTLEVEPYLVGRAERLERKRSEERLKVLEERLEELSAVDVEEGELDPSGPPSPDSPDTSPPPASPTDSSSPPVIYIGYRFPPPPTLNHSQRKSKKQALKRKAEVLASAEETEVRGGAAHPQSTGWAGVCLAGRNVLKGGEYGDFEVLSWDEENPVPLVLIDPTLIQVAIRTGRLKPRFGQLVNEVLANVKTAASKIELKTEARARGKKNHKYLYPLASTSRGGDFIALLLGWSRAYSKETTFTAVHLKDKVEWDEFVLSSAVQDLSLWVSDLVKLWFPKVYERYAAFLSATDGRSLFGIFDLFCVNLPREFKSRRKSVKSIFHSDWKNLAMGLCVVVAFGMFNSRKRFFLCFKELKLIVEFPANCAIIYPSALYVHGNLHASEFKVVSTDGEDMEWEGVEGKEERGSMVWFTQAYDVMQKEMGGRTVKEQRDAGEDATSQFDMDLFRRV